MHIISLISLVPPRIAPFSFEGSPLHAGQYAQVTCLVAEGDLPININWLLNDQSIDNYAEITVAKAGRRTSFLSIESVSYANAGNYTCLAKNKAGTDDYTTQLQVNG